MRKQESMTSRIIMRRQLRGFACATLLAGFAAAPVVVTAQNTPVRGTSPTTVRPAPITRDEDRMTCRVVTSVGSNLRKRMCRSAVQSEQDREAAVRELTRATTCQARGDQCI